MSDNYRKCDVNNRIKSKDYITCLGIKPILIQIETLHGKDFGAQTFDQLMQYIRELKHSVDSS